MAESIDVYATKFNVNVSGLKPDTIHRFYLVDKDVTSDCVPLRVSNQSSNTSSKYNTENISFPLAIFGSQLISNSNGKLEFEYYFKPENSPFTVKQSKKKGPYVTLPIKNQRVYVKSEDGFSFAETEIKVKIENSSNSVSSFGGGVSCFLSWQKVLMADGSWKEISKICQGDLIQGRWSINAVSALDITEVGNRNMYLLNDNCYVDPGHPIWTLSGWHVVDKQHWLEVEYGQECEIIKDGISMIAGACDPCSPDKMNQLVCGKTVLATPDGGWQTLNSIKTEKFDPETKLYSLVLDNCRTMFVDGYCFSGWADMTKVDYDSKIGS
jgi:hypothetical protein